MKRLLPVGVSVGTAEGAGAGSLVSRRRAGEDDGGREGAPVAPPPPGLRQSDLLGVPGGHGPHPRQILWAP